MPINDFTNPTIYLALIIYIVLCGIVDCLLFFLLKHKPPRVFIIVVETLIIPSWLFGLQLVTWLLFASLVVGTVVFFVADPIDLKTFLSNGGIKLAKPNGGKKRGKKEPEALFDRDAVYAKVEAAVIAMAKTKTGALITFEKTDKLSEIMKTGTEINAPVSTELLQTIFYPGTRLHDGAVIIRNDQIAAAAVFFTPTTRALTGKYGSRHRAAIGISDASDAVTVVVSEETGRISIAYDGELVSVSQDSFLNTFNDYMSMKKTTVEENKD